MSAPDELWAAIGPKGELRSTHETYDEICGAYSGLHVEAVRYIRSDAPKADSARDAIADELAEWLDADDIFSAAECLRDNRDAILAALRAQPGGAGPRDATPAMVEAGLRAGAMSEVFGLLPRKIWRAMHDAATKADAREDEA